VLDDPFTSLDEFRQTWACYSIRKLAEKAKQVVVLSHSLEFLRPHRKKLHDIPIKNRAWRPMIARRVMAGGLEHSSGRSMRLMPHLAGDLQAGLWRHEFSNSLNENTKAYHHNPEATPSINEPELRTWVDMCLKLIRRLPSV
jgi:hypothetical protein